MDFSSGVSSWRRFRRAQRVRCHSARLRLPTTQTDEIEVTLLADPAPLEEDAEDVTGRLVWELDLAAGASDAVKFGYDIDWPLGRQLLGQ